MNIIQVQFTVWEKVYDFAANGIDVKINDYVVVDTQVGVDLGKVVGLGQPDSERLLEEIKPIVRKATPEDLEKALNYKKQRDDVVVDCKKMIDKHGLSMKLIDAHFSFDDQRVTFYFIANGRVDFRRLVRDLTSHYNKVIRLQQLGIRDEVKLTGDIGCCGRELCCRYFLKDLGNVTSELAEIQQVTNRGAERISGICGRLRCCLDYESAVYRELAAKLPAIGSKVKIKAGKGTVLGWHTLKQTVDVSLENDDKNIIEVSLEELV